MPRKVVHLTTSAAAGFWYATQKCGVVVEPQRSLEVVGGILGGLVGGRLPDRIEPPTWPGHRDTAHSVTAGAAVVWAVDIKLGQWQSTLRHWAAVCRTKSGTARPGSAEAASWAFLAWLCHFISGALAGVAAGYLMHLGLDALTPAGIRLV